MSAKKKDDDLTDIPVLIYANFVSAKAGTKPKLRIENPRNLSNDLATIYHGDYDLLLEELADLVDDTDAELSFQFDDKHSYCIDWRAWDQDTAIFGRRSKEDGDNNGVITQSKLVPIRDEKEFSKHVRKCGLSVSNN